MNAAATIIQEIAEKLLDKIETLRAFLEDDDDGF